MSYCDGKKLIYTNHAKLRLLERSVTEAEVEYCLNYPEITLPTKCGTLVRYISHVDGRRVEVRVDKKKPRLVITVID